MWPAARIVTSLARGMAAAIARISSGGEITSSSPTTSSAGQAM